MKADIKFEVLHDLTFICQSPCENLWFTVSRDKVGTIIGLIYRHPEGSIKLEFTLDKISKTKLKQGILIGVFNIDLLKYDGSKYKPVKEYLDLLIAHSFFPQTILPSRVTKNTFSLVDHILFQQHHGGPFAIPSIRHQHSPSGISASISSMLVIQITRINSPTKEVSELWQDNNKVMHGFV